MRRRAAQPTQALTPETDPAAPTPRGDAERSARVLVCIEELPEVYRETLRLKYQEELSCKEIAAREITVMADNMGYGDRFIPRLIDVLMQVNGVKK